MSAGNLKEEISKIIMDVFKANSTDKKPVRGDPVAEVREVTYKDEHNASHSALVVSLTYNFLKENRDTVPKFINEIIKRKEKNCFVVSKRTMIHPLGKFNQKIPNNRTLTAVYDSLFEDMIYPAQIVGKRTRFSTSGKKLIKYHLNEESRAFTESRVDLISHVYNQLTQRSIALEFRTESCFAQVPRRKAPRAASKPQRKEKTAE